MDDMIGRRFGKWTVLEYAGLNKHSCRTYKCKCLCERIVIVLGHSLRSGVSSGCRSCGYVSPLYMIGKKFGAWTVVEFCRRVRNHKFYKCQCECGEYKVIGVNNLRKYPDKCEACVNKYKMELVGKKINKWLVTELLGTDKFGAAIYKCVCECGRVKDQRGSDVRDGRTRQCEHCKSITHGMSNTPTYTTWECMKARCLYAKDANYDRYGGRGIRVCERWLNFENFLEDMSIRPEGMQIDRIDNDGNYEPGNCRWVTPKENSANRRPRKFKVVPI